MGSVLIFLFFNDMSITEILDSLNENYELEVDGEKVYFSEIKEYIKRLEKDVFDLNDIVRIQIRNAAIDRAKIKKLERQKK